MAGAKGRGAVGAYRDFTGQNQQRFAQCARSGRSIVIAMIHLPAGGSGRIQEASFRVGLVPVRACLR